MKKYLCIIALLLPVFCVNAFAAASSVKLVKSNDGKWKMTVDGRDYLVKGIEYSADTVGRYPNSNDWMWEDNDDNGRIDGPYDSWIDSERDNYRSSDGNAVGDFALLKAMGCNTIRIYDSENINKELLRDLYRAYGIRVIMGNFFGAYTKGSGASWHEGTDYCDETQRKNMRDSIRKMVLEHKDEPYILMWMLGNENDSPGEEVNSTKTNTNAVKNPEAYAVFLQEVCLMIKQLDPNHPVGVCNATVKFLPYYNKFAPAVDILGFNQYAGPYGFGVLWNRVKIETGKPVLITEYGCDAYSSAKKSEDERFQAKYHEGAWRDIEKNSFWGNGRGNSLGGVGYCWLDKWWLVGSAKVHDTDLGAWKGAKNDGYFHDEWFGICSQGDGKQSPFKRQLREVYFTYQEKLWADDITQRE
ncbi:MAG: hypothetical protein FWC57_05080 [Endomicrobia bacterium]|nr:hypothetical protein [Endomicrobiia bacterium]